MGDHAKMSPSAKLADDQLFALMKLKRSAEDVLQPHHDDRFLLRWLRARKWDVKAAEKMLRDSLQWRKQWGVDKINEWETPEALKGYLPHGLSGFDQDGAPVVIVVFGGLDLYGILHIVTRSDMIKITIKTLEEYLRICEEQVKKHGPIAGQVTVIFDMEGFNMKQYLWRPAGEIVISLIQMYEANYPEILKTCFIINAPKVFSFAFSVAKRFMNEYTISKIQIYKADRPKWKSAILKVVSEDQLPVHFGGKLADPDGNPKYTTKISQGGKVPKEEYVNNGEKDKEDVDYTTVSIKKGGKIELELPVTESGSLLSWDFRSEDHDIKFGVLKKEKDGKATEIVPFKRVAAHQLDEIGMFTCDLPGTYSVVFDNSYSLLRNKKIRHNIRVIPPSEAAKEIATATM